MCAKCRAERPKTDFGRNSNSKDGLFSYCKPCATQHAITWAKNNPERKKETHNKWYQENKETINEEKRAWRKNNYNKARKKERSTELRVRYNISLDLFDEMVDRQEGKCAICGRVPKGTMAIDHDHNCCPESRSCGQCIRGLLCSSCNGKLGWYERYENDIKAYLEENQRASADD